MEITAQMLRDMLISAANNLENNKQAINDLNVFPVPDGDTGTNMSLTMGAAKSKLSGTQDDSVSAVSAAAANALIRGARGNSGVILSLLFRGVSVGLKGCRTADAITFANAFISGVEAAYKAVMKPTEGTILTVARLSAQAAMGSAQSGSDVPEMFADMLKVAKTTLGRTPDMLPVLKQAGVVDAGGKGYITVLEGMQSVLTGGGIIEAAAADATAAKADFESFNTEEINFAYCTEFIIDKSSISLSADSFKAFLDTIGDSIVVVDAGDFIKTHVHTNNPGKALEAALELGSLSKIKIENMKEQHTALAEDMQNAAKAQEQSAAVSRPPEKPFGFVAVAAGEGFDAVFRDLGVDEVIEGGQTMNPSTEDILRAIDKTPAETVYVLPNNKNIIMAAQQCVGMADGKDIVVLQTKTVPQGIAALFAYDPDADAASNTEAMTDSFQAVKTLSVTYAARDSVFDGQQIKQGQFLGLIDGRVAKVDESLEACIAAITEESVAGEESYVNVFYGEGIKEEEAENISSIVKSKLPQGAEVNVVYGGQPVYYYIISIE